MQEREIIRRDRWIGLANGQFDRAHKTNLIHYDLQINTTNILPFVAARQILQFVTSNPHPTNFKKILA